MLANHSEIFLDETRRIAERVDRGLVEAMAARIAAVNGTIYFAGLGGSAANASHAAADFRRLCGKRAVCLTDSAASFSAVANDDGWQRSIAGQMTSLGKDDALFVLSVGGGAEEVSKPLSVAIEFAKGRGATVFGIVGRDGGYTARRGDCVLIVPTAEESRVTPHTEGWQMVIIHLLVSHPALQKRATKW